MKSFYSLTFIELQKWLVEHDLKPLYAQGLFSYFYKEKLTLDADDIVSKKAQSLYLHYTYLPKILSMISTEFSWQLPSIHQTLNSDDQTVKIIFQLPKYHEDDTPQFVEAVLLPFYRKHSICLSTQVGCQMKCSFCYTGTLGLKRHMNAEEIVGIYLMTYKYFELMTGKKQKVPNIVFMGQGEPLHNFSAVKKATEIFLEIPGLGLGPRSITLSTAGYLPGIEKIFAEGFPQINFALSLHSAVDLKRNELIPINQKYPLKNVLLALKNLPRKKRQYLLIEYLLISEFNDQKEDALKLWEILEETGWPKSVIINLIPYNPIPQEKGKYQHYARPHEKSIEQFKNHCESLGLCTMIRTTKGQDIMAACGQLKVDTL